MPYYFQVFNRRSVQVQNYVRAKLNANGVPQQFDLSKPIFSFFPAASGQLDYISINTFLPIYQYNVATKTYLVAISSTPVVSPLAVGLSAFVTKGNNTSAAIITQQQSDALIDVDSYNPATRVFTFTNAFTAGLSAIGTGENVALRFYDSITPYYVVVQKRSTTNGNITATQDFLGFSFDPGSSNNFNKWFQITTFTVDRDLWGTSYTATNLLTSRAYTNTLTAGNTLLGIKAPAASPFVSSQWNIANGYTGLTRQAKRNKLYVTAYNNSTKTYTLSSVYPFTAGNSYDSTFFYNGLSTTVYHNNLQRQIVIGGINTTAKTFSSSQDAWGASYTVPTSAIRRNYVLDLTIPLIDQTSGDWHMFRNNLLQLEQYGAYVNTISKGLCALSAQLIRDTGALSGYSKPFNILAEAKTYRFRYRTPSSGGLPARWINSKKAAFTDYTVSVATLTSTIVSTANYTLTANYNASIARDYSYTHLTFAGQTKTPAITTYPLTYNSYDATNALANVTQLFPLTTNEPFGYNEIGPINNYNALSSLSFVSVSAGGEGTNYNGIYYPTSQIVNNKRVYKNYFSSVLFFDGSNWAIRQSITFDTDTLYYAPEASLTYPWQSAAWVLSTGAAPVPVVTEIKSTFGQKIYQTRNATYVLDAGRGLIFIYRLQAGVISSNTIINMHDYNYGNVPDSKIVEYYDICAAPISVTSPDDYIAVTLKYIDPFDDTLSYYGVRAFNSTGQQRFILDSTAVPHLSTQLSTNKDTAMVIGAEGFAQNNFRFNVGMLYIARANNTSYSGFTGVIDVINLNSNTYLGCRYLGNSYLNSQYPALTNYKFGAAIAAHQNNLFYTISSVTDNTKNIVEYCSVIGNTSTSVYTLTPTSLLSSAESNFGKNLNAYSVSKTGDLYSALNAGIVIDTDRLLVGGDNNVNVHENYLSNFLLLSSIPIKNAVNLAYYTNFVSYSGNKINFYTLSAVC